MSDPEASWMERMAAEVAGLPPVSRGLLLHIMEFQAVHNLSQMEFAGSLGPVLNMFNGMLAEIKKEQNE